MISDFLKAKKTNIVNHMNIAECKISAGLYKDNIEIPVWLASQCFCLPFYIKHAY